ncbi:Ser/Thr-like protein kinase lyk4 [Armadillidium vulgare iridescent virus]|uniref:Serine/threonine-protein kinase 40 n=1 Tax=Armadillidium vulgare iridescent virus TaxID=72201 RepID=A0A068QKJ7_9VIRU|nr:Ser/Thr-like protein kinase lyk4 [Armadillidium vulgare iridescent virus]CCV02496.1 Ser/Thr-like protein kinase lyk4 [Armadillidium vulgare iridescent virus]
MDLLIGPVIETSPVKCIDVHLARRYGTGKYYCIKKLKTRQFSRRENEETDDEKDYKQGVFLIQKEDMILTHLNNRYPKHKGIINRYGMFEDGEKNLNLVLDCTSSHDFSKSHYVTLQKYLIDKKKISEMESLKTLLKILTIVKDVHEAGVVHRDLKLGNLVMNTQTRDIVLTNFWLGEILKEEEFILEQRGSPAYISPEVISGKKYLAKPSDVWAIGVIFYTMLYGQFPFYDSKPKELFRKIKAGTFTFPLGNVSESSKTIIKRTLSVDSTTRPTVDELITTIEQLINSFEKMYFKPWCIFQCPTFIIKLFRKFKV